MYVNYKYFKNDIKPVLCEVMEGEYEGFKFSLFGKSEIQKYFNYTNVKKVIKNRRGTYKKCSFRFASFEEAIPYANKISEELIKKF